MQRAKIEKSEVLDFVKTNLVETKTPLAFPNLPAPVVLTNRSIKSVVSHFHEQPDVRNALMMALPLILQKGVTYVGHKPNHKKTEKPDAIEYLYYFFGFMNQTFYLNIEKAIIDEKVGEVYKLYSS